MKLGVIGTGYVGLVAGAGFSDFGNDVVCVDIDRERVAALRRGEIPIHEPGLGELVLRNIREGRLSFTTEIAAAVRDAEVVLIAVGTPPQGDGSADLGQVYQAAAEVGRAITQFTVVVNKSTVPVGTAERVAEIIRPLTTQPFAVCSNPEFLKEGTAVEDFLHPMRVVVGIGPASPVEAVDRARVVMRRLYEAVVRTNDRLLFTDARSAEMVKYASNAYLATRISFINDVANLCERVGADVEMVRRGMGMDNRIGPKFLFPGLGYGGSCFPKDVLALMATARQHDMEMPLIAATHRINERQKTVLYDKLLRHFADKPGDKPVDRERPLQGKTIAVWGLSFKPETDDVREAPALLLIERMHAAGAQVRGADPVALHTAARALGDKAQLFEDAYEAARGAHALLLCTEWRQYRQPNFRRLRQVMAGTAVLDGRNIWDADQLRELGFTYYGIGRH